MDEDKQARWRASAPKKIVAVKLIIKSDKGNVLLVKPTYKLGWQFPGGGVEVGEAPSKALVRECSEEISLQLDEDQLKLIGTTYQPKDDAVIVIYELQSAISEGVSLTLQAEELEAYEFVDPREVPNRISQYYEPFWADYIQ